MITDAADVPPLHHPVLAALAGVLNQLNQRNRENAALRARLGERDEGPIG